MVLADEMPPIELTGIVVLFFSGIVAFVFVTEVLPHRRHFQEIAREFGGTPRLLPFVAVCKFVYRTMATKVRVIPGGRGTKERLVLEVGSVDFPFRLFLTRKFWGATILKPNVYGPFSRRIRTGIHELDEKMLAYTKQEAIVRNYLANTSVRDTLMILVDDGWHDFYFTPKGFKIEKESPTLADLSPGYLRDTLDAVYHLLQQDESLYAS